MKKVWILFKRASSPGPVPYATLGPIEGSIPYVPASEVAGLVEALEKYAEFDGEYKWISLIAREALAKYGKGGASG